MFFSMHGQNINVKCQMKTVAAEAPLCWLCLTACTHAHFGFVSVPAFFLQLPEMESVDPQGF